MSPEADSAIKVTHLVDRSQNAIQSEAKILINGLNHCIVNGVNANYYVEKGQVTFWLGLGNNERKIILKAGQSVYIPQGTPYQDMGFNSTMLNHCQPPYDPNKVEVLW